MGMSEGGVVAEIRDSEKTMQRGDWWVFDHRWEGSGSAARIRGMHCRSLRVLKKRVIYLESLTARGCVKRAENGDDDRSVRCSCSVPRDFKLSIEHTCYPISCPHYPRLAVLPFLR
jgi:hypothetical protein